MINDGEIAVGLTVTVLSWPFVNGCQVVQHSIRPRDFVLEMVQQVVEIFFGYPEGRNPIGRRLGCEHSSPMPWISS